MSAARNMVRALRESGTFDPAVAGAQKRRVTILVIMAVVAGAVLVILATTVLPNLDLNKMTRGPVQHVNYAKPGDSN